MFPAGSARTYLAMRRALAGVIALRLSFGPYFRYGGQSEAFFQPIGVMEIFPSMPSREVLFAVQFLGAAAAWAVAFGVRPRFLFPVAWTALLLCAGSKTSLGKVLHNDVMLILVSAAFVAGPTAADRAKPDDRSRKWGWAPQLALVTLIAMYFSTGMQKMVHSGLEWVFSDNMRWVMTYAAREGRALSDVPAQFVADVPWLARSIAAGILLTELLFPVALFVRRSRPLFALTALALHAGTFVTLGLDYWGWALVAVIVLVPQLYESRPSFLRNLSITPSRRSRASFAAPGP